MSKVRALPLPVAPPEEMQLVVSRVESTFHRIDQLATEAASARHLLDNLDQAIIARAFRGGLVPQDPNDEPADV
jgi:type I restriction enzyme S subunit